MRPIAATALLLLAASGTVEGIRKGVKTSMPDAGKRAKDLFQCDRQCRWKHGFFDRNIIGEFIKKGLGWINKRQKCRCYKVSGNTARRIGDDLPWKSETHFDSKNTWSGDFTCQNVCTISGSTLQTMTRSQARAAGVRTLHCGSCAACSAPDDIAVLSNSRKWITEVMTKVAAQFSAPVVGHGDVNRLERDLYAKNITFSMSRPDGRKDLPTCMQCWSDNIMCTKKNCVSQCWTKFFDPKNPPSNIEKGCKVTDFNCRCLKCDEEYCGPAFIKCAGANRRSSGIVSDIQRPKEQQCPYGMYSGVPDSQLPTLPKPRM